MAKSKSLVTKVSICAYLSIALSFAYIRVCKAQMQYDQSDPAASTYQQNQYQSADQVYGNAPSMAQPGMPYGRYSGIGGMQYAAPSQFTQGMQTAPTQYESSPYPQGMQSAYPGMPGIPSQAQYATGSQNFGYPQMGNIQPQGQGPGEQFAQQPGNSYGNMGMMQQQAPSNFIYNGASPSNQFGQSQPGFSPMQAGAMTAGQMPSAGMMPQNSHPILSLFKSAFEGASDSGTQAPAQQSTGGAFGLFKTMFGAPSNAQEAEAAAQEDLNTASNEKQQAIDAKNSISGETDKSTRRSYANDASSHATAARSASDKLYSLSTTFPNSSKLSDMASQARSDADYARSMADEASSEAGGGGW